MMQAAFLCMTFSFLRCVLAADEMIEEQSSMCDLIRAVYINLSNSLGRYGVALAKIPKSPNYVINNTKLEEVEEFKDLGVTYD